MCFGTVDLTIKCGEPLESSRKSLADQLTQAFPVKYDHYVHHPHLAETWTDGLQGSSRDSSHLSQPSPHLHGLHSTRVAILQCKRVWLGPDSDRESGCEGNDMSETA